MEKVWTLKLWLSLHRSGPESWEHDRSYRPHPLRINTAQAFRCESGNLALQHQVYFQIWGGCGVGVERGAGRVSNQYAEVVSSVTPPYAPWLTATSPLPTCYTHTHTHTHTHTLCWYIAVFIAQSCLLSPVCFILFFLFYFSYLCIFKSFGPMLPQTSQTAHSFTF